MSYAQSDVVKGVCGVNFGDSYSKAKTALENKYGEPFGADGESIMYFSIDYGGIHFNLAIFNFNNGQLDEVKLINICDTESEAKSFVNEIADVLKRSYSLTQKNSDNKIKYFGGTSPKNSNSYGFVVKYWETESSDLPWCAGIVYGPFGYGESF